MKSYEEMTLQELGELEMQYPPLIVGHGGIGPNCWNKEYRKKMEAEIARFEAREAREKAKAEKAAQSGKIVAVKSAKISSKKKVS